MCDRCNTAGMSNAGAGELFSAVDAAAAAAAPGASHRDEQPCGVVGRTTQGSFVYSVSASVLDPIHVKMVARWRPQITNPSLLPFGLTAVCMPMARPTP